MGIVKLASICTLDRTVVRQDIKGQRLATSPATAVAQRMGALEDVPHSCARRRAPGL